MTDDEMVNAVLFVLLFVSPLAVVVAIVSLVAAVLKAAGAACG